MLSSKMGCVQSSVQPNHDLMPVTMVTRWTWHTVVTWWSWHALHTSHCTRTGVTSDQCHVSAAPGYCQLHWDLFWSQPQSWPCHHADHGHPPRHWAAGEVEEVETQWWCFSDQCNHHVPQWPQYHGVRPLQCQVRPWSGAWYGGDQVFMTFSPLVLG